MGPEILSILGSLMNGGMPTINSPFPTQPNPTQGPLLSSIPAEGGFLQKLFGDGKVLGMTPNNFAAIVGQLGAAISPKGSVGERLGGVAAALGQAKLQELAAAQQHKHLTTMLSSLFADPTKTKSLTNGTGPIVKPPTDVLNQTPAQFYGIDESKLPTVGA